MLEKKDSLKFSIDEKYFKEDEDYNLTTILGKENLEEIQDIISKATGLAFVTVDFRGEPITEMTKFTPYCQLIRNDPICENICKLSDASGVIRSAVTKETSIYLCPFGLLEVALPVIINGRYLGGFIGGQVRCFDVPKNIHQMDKSLVPENLEKSLDLENAIESVTQYSYNEFLAIAKLIEWIISQLTKKELISSHHEAKNKGEINRLKNLLSERDIEIQKLKVKEITFSSNFNRYFLSNVISSVSNLSIIEDAPRTNKFILLYKKFLESSLKEDEIGLKECIGLIKAYLKMTKFQFEDKFSYEIVVEKCSDSLSVDSKFILPFIQYLVFYGLRLTNSSYHIKINIKREENILYFNLSDNGPGYNRNEIQKQFKIYNNKYEVKKFVDMIYEIMKIIVLVYGENYSPEIIPERDKGTYIILKFPI